VGRVLPPRGPLTSPPTFHVPSWRAAVPAAWLAAGLAAVACDPLRESAHRCLAMIDMSEGNLADLDVRGLQRGEVPEGVVRGMSPTRSKVPSPVRKPHRRRHGCPGRCPRGPSRAEHRGEPGEDAVGCGAPGMHHPFRDALVIEVGDLLAQLKILELRRAAVPGLQRVVGVRQAEP
jgi:hypothetical protein